MDRIVLHSDANCFYASVEMLYHPEFDGKPLAVGGDPEARHGIVLTANYIAKRKGVKTGMALWQAKQACPDLIVVPPRMDLYLKFSGMLREIYSDYTNQIEPYGCDESWLDVTGSSSLKGDGRKIAEEISRRVKKELGITVSIGISWNKIFAKLGSDYKKPDGITEFNRQNYKDLIWRLPASDLLYVGRSTRRVLTKYGIRTIGELACADPDFLERQLGKMGLVLYSFANGWDDSQVAAEGYSAPIKSETVLQHQGIWKRIRMLGSSSWHLRKVFRQGSESMDSNVMWLRSRSGTTGCIIFPDKCICGSQRILQMRSCMLHGSCLKKIMTGRIRSEALEYRQLIW